MKKRILVTGGAGFLGSHLIERLLNSDHFVICLDNLQTGFLKNLTSFFSHPNFLFVEHDVEFPLIELKEIKDLDGRLDEIYNLACPASPIHYQKDPVKTIKTSFLGAYNVLELARATGARVLQASTSEIYGDPLKHPQKETYFGNVNSTGERACYDEGKRAAETLFFDFHRMYGVSIGVVRIFNTYGPKMHPEDGRVVSNFIMQALAKKPITMYGTGMQTRSFCYVADLIDGFLSMMKSKEIGPINLGNPTEFTMQELADHVLSITDSKSEYIYKKLPPDDPKRRKPDIALAKTLLNWEPKVPLLEGLKSTVKYFEKEFLSVIEKGQEEIGNALFNADLLKDNGDMDASEIRTSLT